jgi:hypothetical protein
MKTSIFSLLMVAGIFLCANNSLLAQQTHTIILNVNTTEVRKPYASESCDFGQPSDISNEEFTIEANIGDTIIWEGVSSNAPDTDVVNIISINHEGGKNVFSENIIRGDGHTVTAIVENGEEGDEDKYAISFTVMNNGRKRNGMFRIDPKIKIGQ